MARYAAGVAVSVFHGVFLLHGGTTFWSVMRRGGTDILSTSLLLFLSLSLLLKMARLTSGSLSVCLGAAIPG